MECSVEPGFGSTGTKEQPRYISVIGGGMCSAEEYAMAEETGRLIGESGAVLVCGGMSGVMEAAARGAKEAGGTTLGILPGSRSFSR